MKSVNLFKQEKDLSLKREKRKTDSQMGQKFDPMILDLVLTKLEKTGFFEEKTTANHLCVFWRTWRQEIVLKEFQKHMASFHMIANSIAMVWC